MRTLCIELNWKSSAWPRYSIWVLGATSVDLLKSPCPQHEEPQMNRTGGGGGRMGVRLRRGAMGWQLPGDKGRSGSYLFWKPTGLDGFWDERFSDFRKLKNTSAARKSPVYTDTSAVQPVNIHTEQGRIMPPSHFQASFHHRLSLSTKGIKKELPFVSFVDFRIGEIKGDRACRRVKPRLDAREGLGFKSWAPTGFTNATKCQDTPKNGTEPTEVTARVKKRLTFHMNRLFKLKRGLIKAQSLITPDGRKHNSPRPQGTRSNGLMLSPGSVTAFPSARSPVLIWWFYVIKKGLKGLKYVLCPCHSLFFSSKQKPWRLALVNSALIRGQLTTGRGLK